MSWYRVYRPQTVSSLHIAPVREAYLRILNTGSFSHAYLLSGPKGTGKTSGARILAKVLNCERNREVVQQHLLAANQEKTRKRKSETRSLSEPCNTCDACVAITAGASLTVTEMDAASNRGIDDIRALRERVGLSAAGGIVNVTIIDEVHMLTTEAFNALLKVLEEPPAHVVFILATTDPQKMPATIVSRCTPIVYRKALPQEILTALQHIAGAEGIDTKEELLLEIAQHADGSLRDAIKFLEQVGKGKKTVTREDIERVLGSSIESLSSSLLNGLMQKNTQEVVNVFKTVEENGIDGVAFHKRVIERAHERLRSYVVTRDKRYPVLVGLLHALTVPPEPILPLPWLPFEVACLEWTLAEETTMEEKRVRDREVSVKETAKERTPNTSSHNKEETRQRPRREEKEKESEMDKKEPVSPDLKTAQEAVSLDFNLVQDKWSDFLKAVRIRSVPVEGLLRSVRPRETKGNVLVCEASYQFHKEQLEMNRNRLIIEEVLDTFLGQKVYVEFVLGTRAQRVVASLDNNISGAVEDDALVKAAQEAFL